MAEYKVARHAEEKIQAQLKVWQDRLINLSKANPLLCLNKGRVSKLKIVFPDYTKVFMEIVIEEKGVALPYLRRKSDGENTSVENQVGKFEFISGKWKFDKENEDVQLIYRKLRRIYDNSRISVQERGVITLFLAFGILDWDDEQLGNSLSPLILVPCEIKNNGPNEPMIIKKADEEVQFNPALEVYLRERLNVNCHITFEDVDLVNINDYFSRIETKISDRSLKWRILNEVWLSNFSFDTLAIVQDLKNLSEVAFKNEIVATLSKAISPRMSQNIIEEHELDNRPTPSDVPVPVLPCDSSQLKALTMVRGGKNLVIHGPPGTGKSQTITNLIIDALGQNKRVLFVSAKMAALEVVYRRLEQLGFDQFCLEAHSTKAGKATIVEELRRTLAKADGEAVNDEWENHLNDFVKLRNDLNEYLRILHNYQNSLGLSPYQVISSLERLRESPSINAPLPWSDLSKVTKQQLVEALDVLRELILYKEVYQKRKDHPWREFKPHVENDISAKYEIESTIQTFWKYLNLLRSILEKINLFFGDISTITIAQIKDLSYYLEKVLCVSIPESWFSFEIERIERIIKALNELANKSREFVKLASSYKNLWKVSPNELIEILEPVEGKYSSSFRVFSPSYWIWKYKVDKLLKVGETIEFRYLIKSLAIARRLVELKKWYQENREFMEELVGFSIKKYNSQQLIQLSHSADVLLGFLKSLKKVRGYLPNCPIRLSNDFIVSIKLLIETINDNNLLNVIEIVDKFWPGGFVGKEKIQDITLPQLISRCQEVISGAKQYEEWVYFYRVYERCLRLNLDSFLMTLRDEHFSQADTILEKCFYSEWLKKKLGHFYSPYVLPGRIRERKIIEFRKQDEMLRKSWLRYVRAQVSVPAQKILRARDDLGTTTEVMILRRELQKQKRIKPLRKLFSEIPNALLALKPCLLMSPLSVSSFLDPTKFTFDIVIFDEASQILTPEAIPAILRARQVVVAGDSRQLPPTTFFMSSFISDDNFEVENEELIPLESLLDDCIAIYPIFEQAYLRWHYRSKDERLIQFSNFYFYDEKPLITFPSIYRDELSNDQGVRMIYLENGTWDRGGSRTNIVEARKIVDLIVEHYEKHPERSLGIVTMNSSQRELIEELIDDLLISRPDIKTYFDRNKEEPFFIKALENVQGDERDTIIISVGYGKSSTGQLSLNFGPITQEGGWRRLNVLVTRARYQTVLVTSLRSVDLSGINSQNRGAVALRNFIDYAENNCSIRPNQATLSNFETNDFEDAVAESLRKAGYVVDQQVGSGNFRIDLAVRDPRNPNLYLIGIECDGATYHSTPTARDRDIIREQILRELGWQIYRVWSTDWFINREKATEKMLEAVRAAQIQPVKKPIFATSSILFEDQPSKPKNSSINQSLHKYSSGKPYQKCRASGARYIIEDKIYSEICEQLVKVIEIEGPIHHLLLLKRIAEINGFSRTGSKITSIIDKALYMSLLDGRIVRDEQDFFWLLGQKIETFRLPSEEEKRSLEWIPIEEVELAILFVVEDQLGINRDALIKATLRLFGWERLSDEKINSIINSLIRNNKLVEQENKLSLVL